MSDLLRRFVEEYATALESYLSGGGEAALKRAYELGRRALSDGLGVLDLATVHHEALRRIVTPSASSDGDGRTLAAMKEFFAECLSPFEMVHRGFSETNAALRHINETLEKEARRFAHAIHDEVGPLLVSFHMVLEWLARDLPPEKRERLKEAREHLTQIEGHLRRLSHELRPRILEDLGLVQALQFLAEGITIRTGLRIEVGGPEGERLPPTVETALYRIVQEALMNAGKHARATRATVKLDREPGRIRCSVADDGAGFDHDPAPSGSERRGLGLVGIRERLDALGGTLEITSAPGQGARLSITIPLEA